MLLLSAPARLREIFIILLLFPSGPRYLQIRCACLGATEQNWPDTHPRRTQMPYKPLIPSHQFTTGRTRRRAGALVATLGLMSSGRWRIRHQRGRWIRPSPASRLHRWSLSTTPPRLKCRMAKIRLPRKLSPSTGPNILSRSGPWHDQNLHV